MNRQLGMTLMELTVGIAIIALVAVTAGSMFVAGMRSFQARHVANMVMADLRFAMDTMASDLRTATGVPSHSSTQITYNVPGGATARQFRFFDQTVWRDQGGGSSPLAANVASLTFAVDGASITITMTSVSTVDGVTGSGLPLTLTTRVVRRNRNP